MPITMKASKSVATVSRECEFACHFQTLLDQCPHSIQATSCNIARGKDQSACKWRKKFSQQRFVPLSHFFDQACDIDLKAGSVPAPSTLHRKVAVITLVQKKNHSNGENCGTLRSLPGCPKTPRSVAALHFHQNIPKTIHSHPVLLTEMIAMA